MRVEKCTAFLRKVLSVRRGEPRVPVVQLDPFETLGAPLGPVVDSPGGPERHAVVGHDHVPREEKFPLTDVLERTVAGDVRVLLRQEDVADELTDVLPPDLFHVEGVGPHLLRPHRGRPDRQEGERENGEQHTAAIHASLPGP